NLGTVEEELFSPDQPGLDAQLDDSLEEAPKNLEPVALADAGEAGVIGQGLVQVISQEPSQAESVGDDIHQLPLGPQSLEEKNELELVENHRVDASSSSFFSSRD